MNTTRIAQALRMLADAIETPNAPAATVAAPASAPAETSIAPVAAKRGPGRPPKSESPPTAAAPTAPPAAATAPASTAPAQATSGLTHAVVAQDFKNAAAKHGRDFVVGLLKAHNAPTFDKVPVAKLADFQAALRAGPQAAPSGAADDLLG